MATHVISIHKGGETRTVASPALNGVLAALGTQTRRRASHVVPERFWARVLFVALRRIVSDESRAAGWTRTWRCRWLADLAPSGGPVLGPFSDRAEAIRAEVDWLRRHYLGRVDRTPESV